MKFILPILLTCLISSCTTIKNSDTDILHKELIHKNLKEILSILQDGQTGYIAEPPCSLSSIFILSRSKFVTVHLEIDSMPIELRESTINCKWNIEDFYQYYPSMIKIKKIDQAYIEKFDRLLNNHNNTQ